MILALIVFFLILTAVIIFAFPQFSPIPYYPSNMKDKAMILKGLNISNDQTIIDLGAGDGVVIFEAAYEALKKHKNTHFIALDINPILIGIMWIKWLFHPNRNNIKIVWGDMFKINFRYLTTNYQLPACRQARPTTFYLYISPWLIEKAVSHVNSQFPKARFVSYFYPIKSTKKSEKVFHGVHSLYTY
ncbi:hypothetical protein COY90_03985 [Candidatus Roizmanbacteria bacterium CG_4_10_14_0_8_um_filter_39_9]|uniref:Methyltransferase domain-containing protein n=1 Tax=Candidatus Roizmanbacteria bacterium CG_4_10_14_0_8_um_filter_39_9 TaxID=1974829 RepID=A0A2M7QC63_9BACT|nr:MAG: hypothetical protein COY90_03985 [Candidatus Roizmanbacteria bacterium CG_4_10_14_0_8_um_filter_39_9]